MYEKLIVTLSKSDLFSHIMKSDNFYPNFATSNGMHVKIEIEDVLKIS